MYYVSVWRQNWEATEESFDSKKEAFRYCREQVEAGYLNQEIGEVQSSDGATLARYVNQSGRAVKVNV